MTQRETQLREAWEKLKEVTSDCPYCESEWPEHALGNDCPYKVFEVALATPETPASPGVSLSEEQVRKAINQSLQPALAREVVSIKILTQLLNALLHRAPLAGTDRKDCPYCNNGKNESGCPEHGPFYMMMGQAAAPPVPSQEELTRVMEATKWACKDAITGNQLDSSQFKHIFPNGLPDARTANTFLCAPTDEIDKITLESLEKDTYFKIADRGLAALATQPAASTKE